MKPFRHGVFLLMLSAANAYADDYQIDSPYVDKGELSVSANLNYSGDNNKALDHYMSQLYGIGYGVTNYWSTALIGEVEKSSSLSTRVAAVRWENIIAPFKPGEYWVDSGLRLEIDKAVRHGTTNNMEASLLLEKRLGDFINTANLSLDRNFGANAAPGVDSGIAWRTKYHVNDWFEPGIEYYSNMGKLNSDNDFNRQDSVIGPVIQGHFGEVSYDTGILFGVSSGSHDITLKLNLEYTF